MCILCNCGSNGDKFLLEFHRSRVAMREAAAAMEVCSRVYGLSHEQARQYDKIHKQMVRLIHDWNRIEQEREVT